MRKGVLKAIILVAVFVVTVIVTSLLTHHNNIDLTTKMSEASLPTVSLMENGTEINELYGYTREMDGTGVRDAIAPLEEDLTLPVNIKVYQSQIEEISYQVRTMDMERLMEEGNIKRFFPERWGNQFGTPISKYIGRRQRIPSDFNAAM